MTKACSKRCGAITTVVESNQFCYQCGAPLVALPTCRGCGHELMDMDKFCPHCGTAATT